MKKFGLRMPSLSLALLLGAMLTLLLNDAFASAPPRKGSVTNSSGSRTSSPAPRQPRAREIQSQGSSARLQRPPLVQVAANAQKGAARASSGQSAVQVPSGAPGWRSAGPVSSTAGPAGNQPLAATPARPAADRSDARVDRSAATPAPRRAAPQSVAMSTPSGKTVNLQRRPAQP